ncbi:glycosyltransferase family 47 protein [Pelagibacteraceae bacterium]|nr:glycosyltransferase family 47 protein [Pelagibacteraceae bacterium]
MIKLFWNTHNQIPPKQNEVNTENAKNYKWGIYHKNSSNEWIKEVLSKVKLKVVKSDREIEKDDTLILVDSSIEKKIEYYSKLKLICSKIFLIHLGDETGNYDLTQVYKNCDYIWRTFCYTKYFNNEKVSCLPLGYKSGLIYKKGSNKRKYKWAFIGTPHKSSRHDLLYQLSDIKPSFSYKTKKFNEKIMEINEMSEVLASTEFIPCPNGFVHPESYRVYEALECECIPIVESTYNYYERLFPKNPFIKIDKWLDAKTLIKGWKNDKIREKREECKLWWIDYKNKMQELMKEKVSNGK